LASHQSETTRSNLAFFLLGIFVTLSIIGVFSLGSRVFFHWQRGDTALVTGEENLDQLIKTDVNLFWTLVPNLKNKQVTETLANAQHTPSTYTYSTNEMGFRSPPLHPVGSRFRILAIGDSTTFGQHVADHETWPAQLQQILDPKGEVIEVINAGVIGASSFQGLSFLNTRGLALKPNVVIATFGFNDWAGANMSDRERAAAYQRRGTWDLLNLVLGSARREKGAGDLVQRATPGEYLDHMLAIAHLCEEAFIPVVFILWPKPYDPKDPEDNQLPYMRLLFTACDLSAADCFDPRPYFKIETKPVFIDWVHATPAGCRIAAQSLADFLRKYPWMPVTQ